MNEKLVSIAMATYNGEYFLKEQLESLLNQTYRNIEIIICDDKSTDNTISIIYEYMKSDKRIVLYQNKINLGYIKNFEKAISLCNGDFIALSDQDDIWLLNKISTLMTEIGDSLLIHSDAYLIDNKSSIINQSYTEFSRKMIYPKSIIDMILNGAVTGCTSLFSKQLLQNILPFPINIDVHDKWIGINAFYFGKIKYIDKKLIKYRQHSNNIIGAQTIGYIPKIKTFTSSNVDELFINERKILCLTHIFIKNSSYKFNWMNIIKLKLLSKYYDNIINSVFPITAFSIRILLFSSFEKSKPISHKIFSLFSIFKKILLTIGQYFVNK